MQDYAAHDQDPSQSVTHYASLTFNIQGASGGGTGGGQNAGQGGGAPFMGGGRGGGAGGGGAGGGQGNGGGGGGGSGQNNPGQAGAQPNQQGALPTVTVVDCSTMSSSSPCTFNHTFRSLDREYWDFSIGVTAPGVREPMYATPNSPPTVTTHTDAYGIVDLYPAAHWFTPEQAFPHFIVGLPVTGKPFYRPAFGIAENLTAWTGLERRGFPLRINVFAGLVYMKQEFVVGNPDQTTAAQMPLVITHGRSLKGVFGFEVPVTALVSKITGGSSSGSPSGKSKGSGN